MAWKEITPVRKCGANKTPYIYLNKYGQFAVNNAGINTMGLKPGDRIGFVENTDTKALYIFKAKNGRGYTEVKKKKKSLECKFSNSHLTRLVLRTYGLKTNASHKLLIADKPTKYNGEEAYMLEKAR